MTDINHGAAKTYALGVRGEKDDLVTNLARAYIDLQRQLAERDARIKELLGLAYDPQGYLWQERWAEENSDHAESLAILRHELAKQIERANFAWKNTHTIDKECTRLHDELAALAAGKEKP